jgi:hypothetical protein
MEEIYVLSHLTHAPRKEEEILSPNIAILRGLKNTFFYHKIRKFSLSECDMHGTDDICLYNGGEYFYFGFIP